jgi:hypothetical protein
MQLLPWQVMLMAFWMIGFIVVNGFSPLMKLQRRSPVSLALKQVSEDHAEQQSAAMTFLTSTAAALLIMASQPIPAIASSLNPIENSKYAQDSRFALFLWKTSHTDARFLDVKVVPTIQVAETIKELDFSLPKYDDIKSYKASAENVESLTIKVSPIKPGSLGLSTASSSGVVPSSASDDDSNPVNSVMSSLLPSLSKKGPTSP